jgi:hypothetical protein
MLKTFLVSAFAAAFFALASSAFGADVAPTSDTPKEATPTTTNPASSFNEENDQPRRRPYREQSEETTSTTYSPSGYVPAHPPTRDYGAAIDAAMGPANVKTPAVTSGTSYMGNNQNTEPVHHDQNVIHVEPPHHDSAGAPIQQGSGVTNPFIDGTK